MNKNENLWGRFGDWLRHWLKPEPKPVKNRQDPPTYLGQHKVKPNISYKGIKLLEKTPTENTISKGDFVTVTHNGKRYWAIFKCPCSCGELISLSLNHDNKPHWTIKQNNEGRPSLYPSVWQTRGCCSHFWIDDGRVYWCNDSGILPWVAKPNMYTNPN